MKKIKWLCFLLAAAMLLPMVPFSAVTASAADSTVEVSTWDELKRALEYTTNCSVVKVIADIETKDLNGRTGPVSYTHLIRKLLFGGEIIVQSFFNAVPIRINYGIAVQHPLFFCDVVLPDLSGVVEYALKQSAVNGKPLGRRKLKCLFSQQLRYSCRNDIC